MPRQKKAKIVPIDHNMRFAKVSMYIGYGEEGMRIKEELKRKAKAQGKTLNKYLLDKILGQDSSH